MTVGALPTSNPSGIIAWMRLVKELAAPSTQETDWSPAIELVLYWMALAVPSSRVKAHRGWKPTVLM